MRRLVALQTAPRMFHDRSTMFPSAVELAVSDDNRSFTSDGCGGRLRCYKNLLYSSEAFDYVN